MSESYTKEAQRLETRVPCEMPRMYIRVLPHNMGDEASGGMAVDISSSGVGLIMFCPYPVGTKVDLKINNNCVATGEIVNVEETWDGWDANGMVRVGVRLTEKVNWPF